jgi:hypothetical protein
MQAFDWMKTNVQSELRHLCADQSETGHADAETMLRTKWPNFTMNFDLWHKVYPFTAAWKKFINTRFGKRGAFKYPFLRSLSDRGILTANKLKSWWINCSEECKGDEFTFLTMWLGASEHWIDKYWKFNSEEESSSEDNDSPVWKVGQELEAMYHGDCEYYYGQIVSIPEPGKYEFKYDDGTPNEIMAGEFIRERTPIEGPPVEQYEPSDDSEEDSENECDQSEDQSNVGDENDETGDMDIEQASFSREYYIEAIYDFLHKQSKNAEYFLHGKVTSETESFHNLVGKYYRKGTSWDVARQNLVLHQILLS